MLPISIEQLANAVDGELIQGDPNKLVKGVVIDSRKAASGDLFVAFIGAAQNGHRFVANVARQGASAAFVTEDVQVDDPDFGVICVADPLKAIQTLALRERRSFDGPVIGVTGSNGKTTTKELLAAVFTADGPCLYTEANLNTELGLPLTILRRQAQHKSMVLEMGMRGMGQIRDLCGIAEPTAGIITNIGQSHLELLGSQENIAIAKAELLQALPPNGIAVLNGGDAWLRKVAHRFQGQPLWYGMDRGLDAWASDVRSEPHGTTFTAHVLSQVVEIHLATYGKHNVLNALGALLLGAAHGLDVRAMAQGIAAMRSSAGRLHIVPGKDGRRVIDDSYNASPASVRASIDVLVDLTAGSQSDSVAVLGEMYELGSYTEEGHREVGEYAVKSGVSQVIAIGPYAKHIAEAAGAAGGRVVYYPDKTAAMKDILEQIPQNATVLVKASRGAKLEEIVELLAPGQSALQH